MKRRQWMPLCFLINPNSLKRFQMVASTLLGVLTYRNHLSDDVGSGIG
jgi:hypothetical protein